MADITYVDVRVSKTKRIPPTSQESPERVFYSDLSLIHQPGGAAPAAPPVCSFLSRALVVVVVLLLAVVIVLTVFTLRYATQIHFKTKKTNASDADSTCQICPTSSSKFQETDILKDLKTYLCGDMNESICLICPHKWLSFRNRCYFFSEQSESWDFSKKYCLTHRSDLIIIDDQNEIDFIEGKDISKSYFWIGLQYNKSNSEWSWLNGSTLQNGSIPVRTHKPGNDCGSYSSREIYPQDCNYRNKWVCEKEAAQFDERFFGTN
ncbi:C-type lectin domain family 12 member B-like [Lissotriton helveticus]